MGQMSNKSTNWLLVHPWQVTCSSQAMFGTFLTRGGEWMWEGIHNGHTTKHDISWLVEGMQTNSLVWVTNGSYDRKRAPVISGVGWIIFCQPTGKHLVGSFWEKFTLASSYRAKLLGLCLLHLFALALSEFDKVSGWKAMLNCDNLWELILCSHDHRHIKLSTACSDIHCNLCSTKTIFTCGFKYQHVAGHMDKYVLWHQLSLVQQLNCVCDTNAKGAVQRAITTGYISTPTQTLPREDIAIVIWGNKITSNDSHSVRLHASKEIALGAVRYKKVAAGLLWGGRLGISWSGHGVQVQHVQNVVI